MSKLRKKMIAQMELGNYSESTIKLYVHAVEQLSLHHHSCPSKH